MMTILRSHFSKTKFKFMAHYMMEQGHLKDLVTFLNTSSVHYVVSRVNYSVNASNSY
jgi:hypothetical protein